MTKRTIILLLALLIVPLAGWADVLLVVNEPAGTISAGDSFWVKVNVSGAQDLFAYQFDLTFDANLLLALGAANGDFLPAADLLFDAPLFIPDSGGIIGSVANFMTGDAPGANGDGWLASVQFLALRAGVADIEPSALIFLNSNLDQAPDFSGAGTEVTIVDAAGSTVPEPSSWILLAGMLAGAFLIRHRRLAR